MISPAAAKWIRFVRQYGPIPRNDNMYDEHIRKSAKRAGIRPLEFKHPVEDDILGRFKSSSESAASVILTGTAGDGKSHLCGKIWKEIGGDEKSWASDDVYHTCQANIGGSRLTVHVIRDLTAMPQADPQARYSEKSELLQQFCRELCHPSNEHLFLIAANDGQLIETLQKLATNEHVLRIRALVERLLVEDRGEGDGVPLRLFNLSRISCTALFDLALEAFLGHEGWQECYEGAGGDDGFFGSRCPIRHNYELLKAPLIRSRLRSLFELCDCNDLHVPIRRFLLLFSNAILGHPDAKDRLLQAGDVAGVLHRKSAARASLFNNIFGGNLSDTRRESLEVFDYLNRFRVGHETSNRVDNILIFGEADENLKSYFDALLRNDTFYGADDSYYGAQRTYVEGDDTEGINTDFLNMLVSQRRGLFFKIPREWEKELSLWELTVFKYAGEYLEKVLAPLRAGGKVERAYLTRLVKGLNRIFMGMLVNTERDLLLATSISFSTSKISQVLEDQVSVTPRGRERVELVLEGKKPSLIVHFAEKTKATLPLNLTRYEFLSRVAEGALPGSFSRECYEDMLAFKSRLLTCLAERRTADGAVDTNTVAFRVPTLDAAGNVTDDVVEVTHD